MTKNNNISIIVASDNHYAILIAALLKSIGENHKTGEHIDFYIIDDGISAESKKKLASIPDPAIITLKWFKSKDIIPADITIPIDKSGFPLTAYMRVFAPYVVDQQLDKLIYLDVDTIVQDDISKLWGLPLGDYVIGAVLDPGKTLDCAWGGVPNYRELGLTADTPYFNSGVLLINPKQWRAEGISAQIINALSKYHEHVKMADQYGFNVVFANKWLKLDPKWNWFAHQEDENAHIIHFLDIKPIFKSYNSQEVYKTEFFRYLAMTPWKNFKPISGSKRTLRKITNRVKKALMKVIAKKS
jgi:lipopolysaccharide biosynthesis glycosyltransferase